MSVRGAWLYTLVFCTSCSEFRFPEVPKTDYLDETRRADLNDRQKICDRTLRDRRGVTRKDYEAAAKVLGIAGSGIGAVAGAFGLSVLGEDPAPAHVAPEDVGSSPGAVTSATLGALSLAVGIAASVVVGLAEGAHLTPANAARLAELRLSVDHARHRVEDATSRDAAKGAVRAMEQVLAECAEYDGSDPAAATLSPPVQPPAQTETSGTGAAATSAPGPRPQDSGGQAAPEPRVQPAESRPAPDPGAEEPASPPGAAQPCIPSDERSCAPATSGP